MIMQIFLSFLRDERGVAAAEMALITPMLITLMFGSFELGNYFFSEHVVVKSTRDAARFAARQYSLYSPPSCTPGVITADPAPDIDKIARYGKLTVNLSDEPKVYGWSTAVTVELSCPAIGSYSGIYKDKTNIPVITVSAAVPYTSLFERIGFDALGLTLNASSQAAVTGI